MTKVKNLRSAVLKFLKTILPNTVYDAVRLLWFKKKGELLYLETHLADHCNLNCRSCTHYSPISPDKLRDFDSFRRDMMRLREIFSNIRVIRLMGGEPLLHPRVTDFIATAREAFPRADIRVVTNGVLLLKMPEMFWTECARNQITIDMTHYPINLNFDAIKRRAAQYEVVLADAGDGSYFNKYHMNLNGDSDLKTAFHVCKQNGIRCTFLDDNGHIYPCAIAPLSRILSKEFNVDLPVSEKDSTSIYNNVTSSQIISALNTPIPFCRFCTTKVTPFKWTQSKGAREEWLD